MKLTEKVSFLKERVEFTILILQQLTNDFNAFRLSVEQVLHLVDAALFGVASVCISILN